MIKPDIPERHFLSRLGWDSKFESHFQSLGLPGSVPGRVASDNRQLYQVFTENGPRRAVLPGRLRYQAGDNNQYPVVGDWVALTVSNDETGIVQGTLPRKTSFSRQGAGGRTAEQVIAANIDYAFIVGALDEGRSTNARRFERFLTLVWASGADPVIVLNKADLCPDIESQVSRIRSSILDIPVHVVSAARGTGLDSLDGYTAPGKTVALLGPSGVGKSTLVNAFLGEQRQDTGEIRQRDHTGRHVTSARELLPLPGGGVIIDTPGIREIQLWADDSSLGEAFDDIETLAGECRFSDCGHAEEPGCAVKDAVQAGLLDEARLQSFRKLRKELRYQTARQDANARRIEQAKWKKISRKRHELRKDG